MHFSLSDAKAWICLCLLATIVVPTTMATSYEGVIKPLFEKYCYDCHGDGMEKGGLALDSFRTQEEMLGKKEQWLLVIRNLRSGEMPPEKKPKPSLEERDAIIQWIESEVFKTDCRSPDPGRVTLRRLNRAEYNNTIRDLVGVDFQPAADFPADDVGYGFDNIGDVLSLSPVLFEKYLAAAEKIMDKAIHTGGPKLSGPSQRIEAETMKSTADGGPYGNNFAMALMREGEVYTTVRIEKPGEYYLRVRAFGQQSGPELPKLELRLNGNLHAVHEIKALENSPEIYETKLSLEKGEGKLAAAYINNFRDLSHPNPDLRDRNLFIDYLELIGPLTLQPIAPSHARIFFVEPSPDDTNGPARQIIERFASHAFRRPVQTHEIDRLLQLYSSALESGETFQETIRVALTAVLVSPHFLFRGEIQPEPDNPRSIHPINEYALASRLSYFLWSTMPDEELFNLAASKQLRAQLENQVNRMLRDPRSRSLTDNFAAQWLQIRNLVHLTPAKEAFPSFDEELRASMSRETELFFDAVLRENRSVLEFLDADFTFVNERLARHYGLAGINGSEFQRVDLPQGSRGGGILSHASVLTITSNPTRTSPVKRGKWVLDNILGMPPPPPPPDVPELNEDKALTGSLRQRMEQHREKPICASCHNRMDPIGFGFENFDAIGAWREQDGGGPIEPAGKLVTGENFQSPAELKKILLSSRREDYLRCLTEKMLTYALGRGTEYFDRCAVDQIVAALHANEYRFQSLVLEIVKSVPFQQRRGESAQ